MRSGVAAGLERLRLGLVGEALAGCCFPLGVQVGTDGQARWASMVDSSGSAALDAAILTSVSACAWMPATYRGAAIAVTQLETFGDDPRARPAMP